MVFNLSFSGEKHPIRFSSKAAGILISALTRKELPVRMKVKGNSMYPIIKNEDTVTIRPLKNYTLELGDIGAFIDSDSQNLIIHRVIRKFGNAYLTKGDFNLYPDKKMPYDSANGYITQIGNHSNLSNMSIRKPYKKIFALLSRFNMLTIISKTIKKIT